MLLNCQEFIDCDPDFEVSHKNTTFVVSESLLSRLLFDYLYADTDIATMIIIIVTRHNHQT